MIGLVGMYLGKMIIRFVELRRSRPQVGYKYNNNFSIKLLFDRRKYHVRSNQNVYIEERL